MDLIIKHNFNNTIEQVWKAWSNADLVMQWWGPDCFTCPSAVLDFRVGGQSLLCMRAPKEFGGQDMYSTWLYEEIVPGKRIGFIHNLSDKHGAKADPIHLGLPAGFPQDMWQAISFENIDSGGTALTVTEFGWTPGKMMELSKLGMEQCLKKMEKALVQN